MNRELKGRANSVGSLEEFLKRKREPTEEKSEEEKKREEEEVFQRSKRTDRTPKKKVEEKIQSEAASEQDMHKTEVLKQETGMNPQDLQKIKTMLETVLSKTENELKQELKKNREETMKLKEEFQKKEKEWEKDKEQLYSRIENLEEKIEAQEREKKRNNIVIKGIKINEPNLKEKVEEFIVNNLGVNAKIADSTSIGRQEQNRIIVAKIESFEQKIQIMKNKGKLRNTKVFIESDLTVKERKIQQTINEKAKEERATGSRVKVGYQKLIVDNKKYVWNKKKGTLELDPTAKN